MTVNQKMIYLYSGENTSPAEVFEIPYVLQNNDLINPNS
jgi:hypothetical protein